METRPYTPHKTNTTGQLRSLEDRMTNKQFERRSMKAAARAHRTGALALGGVQAIATLLNRGFFGRLKWLLTGR